MANTADPFTLEVWSQDHPRWPVVIDCLTHTAPEQVPFVVGDYSRNLQCCSLVALQDDRVVGLLRFGIQALGREEGCPPLVLGGVVLTEAKIHAFAVRPESRRQGVGSALQRRAIALAREYGCYQLASHSSYDREANCRVKLALGFCALPESQGSIRFVMPLTAPDRM